MRITINKEIVDWEINFLDRDVKRREEGKSNENTASLMNRLTYVIANLQVVSPEFTIDRSSPQFKQIINIYTRIQKVTR